MSDKIQATDFVIIQTGNRKGETGRVIYVRMAPPDYAEVAACSVLCLDGRQSIYPVEDLKKNNG